MTTISNVGVQSVSNTDSSASSRQGSSRHSASLGQILKTAGVLALALSGGAQARPMDSFSHARNLNQDGNGGDYHSPYGYKTLCESGIIDHYAKGMSYEDCLVEENTAIDKIKDSKPLALLKRCYTGSGSLSGALTGVSLASLIGCTGPGAVMSAISISLAGVALLPTTICGGVYATIRSRIRDSREEADDCCKHFPTLAVVQANEAKAAANNTATGAGPAASNTSQALVPAAAVQSSNETATVHPVASITLPKIPNSTSTQQVKTLSNSTTVTTVTTVTNTTVSHHPKP
ncbi:hypothetical protein EV673_1304 [Limnobacter thiooxidans]|uniref:Uncharacterized protein n=1 Tax=Limnobacter thiooxidans TaxID=131080 RepID=A0AA86J6Y2_9BURK|nr:hypothetical protein EV673_1304 [Limnobacter thiooxidans]BET25605.1 hypothetical protein RGQ30_11060 [Limnobacter thiooxidans]